MQNSFAKKTLKNTLLAGVSVAAVSLGIDVASAQQSEEVDELIVQGIRKSLQSSSDLKRNAKGIVDAISAEEMGKFPDTNLAESLQRISGVSIDRQRGEGSTVTVRGFGPEYNLVTFNGRQIATSTLGDGASAPSSRSFDFANLASEGIAGLEVYKTGKAPVASGGIGSVININTTRPLDDKGFKATASYKVVQDESWNGGSTQTPEISGLISNTWDLAEGEFGVSLSLISQERKSSVNQATVGWRDAYYGNEGNWGSIVGNANHTVTNGPADTDVYRIPQNMAYSLIDFESERFNGLLTMQYAPNDKITATLDILKATYEIEARSNDVSIWFNHGTVASVWGDGNPKPIISYNETFDPAGPSDFSMGAALTANENILDSVGLNLEVQATENLSLVFDYNRSESESKPNSEYGSNNVIGTAAYQLAGQGIDFSGDLPIMSVTGVTDQATLFSSASRQFTGNVYRFAYMKANLDQGQVHGTYDFTNNDAINDIIDSVDFGISIIDNKIESKYGFRQNDTWGGIPGNTPANTPDDLFKLTSLPSAFGTSSIIPQFHRFNFEEAADFLRTNYNVCGADNVCFPGYTNTNRTLEEETTSFYIQLNKEFELFGRPANVVAGLRHEETEITSTSLSQVPVASNWATANEFYLGFAPGENFLTLTSEYDYDLPSLDFDIDITDDAKLRMSWSETITRPTYADLQAGYSIDQLFRIDRGTGSGGNPELLPFESENFDISAEYYYGDLSYISVGYFTKDVDNWITSGNIDVAPFNVGHPGQGPRYDEAVAAVGTDANDVRNWIIANYPGTTEVDANGLTVINGIAGQDPNVPFRFTAPTNGANSETIDGWEIAWQHDFTDTGFGFLANYTIVDGSAEYNNLTNAAAGNQFALVGLSDSANLVAYYDKDGLQARVAYNWRDSFLNGTGNHPSYVEEYEQIDMSASYRVNDNVTVFFDGINMTEEDLPRTHGRDPSYVYFAAPGFARYYFGIRYTY
ncbi:MAG: TonB-dependent receptor [Candidatus Micropelagos thuwalensis]